MDSEISVFVSKPCVAVNPCDKGSVLAAAKASFVADLPLLKSTATSKPLGSSGSSAATKKRNQKRPKSQDSTSSGTNAPCASPAAPHACARSAGGSGSLSCCSMLGAVHSQSVAQNTSTSEASGRTNEVLGACTGNRAHLDDPGTSDSLSGDPKTCRAAQPHTCTAAHVAAASTPHEDVGEETPRPDAASAPSADVQRPAADACATGRRPSSIHSRHSSYDVLESAPDAELSGKGGWWKLRNRSAFLGEDVAVMGAVEEALEAVESVHETDSLMYHEMMLPAWELTPVRNPCSTHQLEDLCRFNFTQTAVSFLVLLVSANGSRTEHTGTTHTCAPWHRTSKA